MICEPLIPDCRTLQKVYILSPPPPPPPADQDLDQDLCFHASCPLPLTSLLQSNKIPPRQKHCLYTTWGLLFEIVTQLASISALPVYSGIFESLKHYQLDGQAAEFKFQSKLAPAGYLAITGTPKGYSTRQPKAHKRRALEAMLLQRFGWLHRQSGG